MAIEMEGGRAWRLPDLFLYLVSVAGLTASLTVGGLPLLTYDEFQRAKSAVIGGAAG